MKQYFIIRSRDQWDNDKYLRTNYIGAIEGNHWVKSRVTYYNDIKCATKFETLKEAMNYVNKSKAVGLSILKIEEVYNKEVK